MALKEWAAVVAALASGEQTVLFRKGGLRDGGGKTRGFTLKSGRFALFPTNYHPPNGSAADVLARPEASRRAPDMRRGESVPLRVAAEVTVAVAVDPGEVLRAHAVPSEHVEQPPQPSLRLAVDRGKRRRARLDRRVHEGWPERPQPLLLGDEQLVFGLVLADGSRVPERAAHVAHGPSAGERVGGGGGGGEPGVPRAFGGGGTLVGNLVEAGQILGRVRDGGESRVGGIPRRGTPARRVHLILRLAVRGSRHGGGGGPRQQRGGAGDDTPTAARRIRRAAA